MDEERIALILRSDEDAKWPCRACKSGRLFRNGEHAFRFEQTAKEVEAYHADAWEPDSYTRPFTLHLVCNWCCAPVLVVGDAKYQRAPSPDDNGWHDLKPEHVLPALQLFNVPQKTPAEVREAFERSFKLFWVDPASSLNALRSALEIVLTEQKEPKKRKRKSDGKFYSLTLHKRIEAYGAKHPVVAESLKAVKWLGNAGSHAGREPGREDVLDAYVLAEDILGEVYGRNRQRLDKMVKAINKKKGPIRKKR